jgi:hypothetical protein
VKEPADERLVEILLQRYHDLASRDDGLGLLLQEFEEGPSHGRLAQQADGRRGMGGLDEDGVIQRLISYLDVANPSEAAGTSVLMREVEAGRHLSLDGHADLRGLSREDDLERSASVAPRQALACGQGELQLGGQLTPHAAEPVPPHLAPGQGQYGDNDDE